MVKCWTMFRTYSLVGFFSSNSCHTGRIKGKLSRRGAKCLFFFLVLALNNSVLLIDFPRISVWRIIKIIAFSSQTLCSLTNDVRKLWWCSACAPSQFWGASFVGVSILHSYDCSLNYLGLYVWSPMSKHATTFNHVQLSLHKLLLLLSNTYPYQKTS